MSEEAGAWRLVAERTVARDAKLVVRENDYELPGGKRQDGYLVLEEQDGAIVGALTPTEELVLVRQYRVGVERERYELPAGYLEAGETDALARARAELREETGYTADAWHALGTVHPAPSRYRKNDHCFLALGARKQAAQELDETEAVEAEVRPLAEVERMIQDGRFGNAECIAALYLALRMCDRLAGR